MRSSGLARWQLTALCLAALALASPAQAERFELRIAAGERYLWLAFVGRAETHLFCRDSSEFGPDRLINRRVERLIGLDEDVIALFDDRSLRRYWADKSKSLDSLEASTPELSLAGRHTPIELVGRDGTIFALVESEAAANLRAWSPAAGVTTRPFQSQTPLALVRYRGSSWSAIADVPTFIPVESDLPPRLCATPDGVHLLVAESATRVVAVRLDLGSAVWGERETIDTAPLDAFWVVNFNRSPTLVTAHVSDGASGPAVAAYRRLGESGAGSWRPGMLLLSALPEGATLERYTDVVAHGQDLALLAKAQDQNAVLRFGRIAAAPGQPTLLPATILSDAQRSRIAQGSLQLVTLLLLFGVLSVLFIFRRDSMMNSVVLPSGCELAFTFQRLAGFLIDFVPFTLAAAAALQIDWQTAAANLASWGLTNDPALGLPTRDTLLWWGLSGGGYVVYALILELTLGRTIGKVVTRTRLLAESAQSPAAWQIVTRNVVRLIELLPQFWILGFLVLISRNRQRLGDIFARTVVIRRALGSKKPVSEPPRDDSSAE